MKKDLNKEIALFKKYVRKVKLKRVYELLDITPNDYQQECIDDWDNHFDEWSVSTSTLGRRSGKSFTAGITVATHLQVPYASVALIAPNLKLTEVIWNEVITTLQKLGVKPQKINTQSKSLTMENGAMLQAGSLQSPEALLGKRWSLVCCDEAAIDDKLEAILELQIMPATTDFGFIEGTDIPYSKLLLYSTPRGKKNIQYKYHMLGKAKKKGYKSYQYPSTVNPIVTQAFLDTMKSKMDDLTFQQEYEAKFVDIQQNTALHSFDETKNTFKFSKIQNFVTDMNVICGIDIGFRDSSSHVLIAKDRDCYYCFSAIRMSQLDTKSIHANFLQQEKMYNVEPEVRYIDKSAALTAYDLASIYDYVTYPCVNDRKVGIATLNQLFREEKLFIEETLTELIEEIITLAWKESGKDFVRSDTKHHHDLVHALRYAITSDYANKGNQDIIVI